MATDRVIKTDGDLDITATDTSISGTLNVSGQATLSGLAYPSSDGSADQVIKTDGSGNLSFVDQASGGGGVDTITSASEAANYTGTANVIYITSTEDVTFTSTLYDRIIFVYGCNVKFQDCDLSDSFISLPSRNLTFENTSTNGTTDVSLSGVTIKSKGDLILDASGNTSGNIIKVLNCKIRCEDFTPTDRSNVAYTFNGNDVFVQSIFDGGDATNNLDISNCNINTHTISGEVNLPTNNGSTINVRHESLAGTKIKIGGTTYIDGAYAFPFKVNKDGVDTKVVVNAVPASAQSVTTSNDTKVIFGTETFDNTSAFSSSTFTAKVKGHYTISGNLYAYNMGAGNTLSLKIYKGTTPASYRHYIGAAVNSTATAKSISYIELVELDVNEKIEIYVDSSDTSYNIYELYTSLNIQKVN